MTKKYESNKKLIKKSAVTDIFWKSLYLERWMDAKRWKHNRRELVEDSALKNLKVSQK